MPVRETILVPPTSDVRVEEWPRSRRGVAGRLASAIGSCVEWTFGVFSLIVGLSVIATVPILQFASLGYLLESAGRVARSGRLRDGVIGARRAARVGSCILGTWLLLQPIRWAFSVRYDAQLLGTDKGLRQATLVAVVLSVFLGGQILSATLRGGRLRSFFWPAPIWLWRRLCQGNVYRECRDHCWNFVTSLRVPFYFTKGVRGFGIALVWLIVPASIMVISTRLSEGPALLL